MKKVPLVLFILAFFVICESLKAQASGDYRTMTSGNWDSVSIWQQYNGTDWIAAITPPTELAGVITIRPGDTVISDRNRTADELIIAAGGTLHLSVFSGSAQLLLHNGPGIDLVGNGHLIIDGNATLAQDTLTGGSEVTYTADTLTHFGGIGPQFTFNGSVGQVITGSGYMGTVIVNNPGNLEITATTSFQAITFVNGKINVTGNGILVVTQYGNGFTGQSNTRFIDGKVTCIIYEKNIPIPFSLPVGKGNEYLPIEFTVTQDADVQASFSFTIHDGAPPIRNLPSTLISVSAVRYYTVAAELNGSNISNAQIRFSYNVNDGVTDTAQLHIAKSNGTDWVDLGANASGSPNGSVVSTANFTTFSDFVLADAVDSNTTAGSLNYHFSAISGTYTNLTAGTTAVLTADRDSADARDDGYANALPIGFTFNYNGTDYTTISANTNGFASFQNFIPISDTDRYDYYTPNLVEGPASELAMRPVLAPLWDDHDLFSDGGISYKTEGTAPNRMFTLQWDKVYWPLTSNSTTGTVVSFQLKLFETTNIIQFQYKQESADVGPGAAASIGITGTATGPGNFLSINNTTNTPTASSTTETFTLVTKPATGQIYQFTPITTFYSKANGDITDLTSWGSNADGSGNSPLNFTGYDQQFNLVNRSGTVDLSTATGVINMGGELNIGPGINLSTAGKLVIKSYPTHTGRIGIIPASSSISGDLTVERFISAQNNRAFRLLTPSVTTSTSIFANWQEANTTIPSGLGVTFGTHITGDSTGNNGFDATATGQPSLFLYDQLSATQKYDAITDNTNVKSLSAKTGYLLFVRGDRNPAHLASVNSSSDAVLRAKGTMLYGTVNYLSQEGNGRFSLVTNPYPAPINWNTLYNDSTTVDSASFENYYTYLDPNIGSRGGYVAVNLDGTRSLTTARSSVEIQSGEAFFVKAKSTAVNPTFVVKEAHKGSAANIDHFRTAAAQQFSVSLFYTDPSRGRRIADGATALFNDKYTIGIDANDAEKVPNFDESISFARDHKLLSIESRPPITKKDSLFLNIARLKKQPYEWEFEPAGFGNGNLNAGLKDNFLGTITTIKLNQTSVIPFTVTNDPASSAADRFTIVFAVGTALPVEMSGVKAFPKAAGVQVEWNTLTEANIDSYEVEKSSDGQSFTKAESVQSKGTDGSGSNYNWFDVSPFAGANYYRIRSVGKDGNVVYSAIIKVTIDKAVEVAVIYPNPVNNGIVNLQLNNLEKGNYNLFVLNDLGQQVYAKAIRHMGGTASYKLPLKGLALGMYQLQVTGNDKIINLPILVTAR